MIEVLARSDRWAVVSKPSGLPIHRSAMVREQHTLIREVRRALGEGVDPVHRLDRATSGCLLLSLDKTYTAELQAALAGGEKRYLAMVRGAMALDPVVVDRPMAEPDGRVRDAVTDVRPLGASPDPRCSLVLAAPRTGRFHQVRRHLRDLNHPVVGDSQHGDTRVNRWWREELGLDRLALHCFSMRLPLAAGDIDVRCPVPDDLLRVWRRLPWWADAVQRLPDLETA